MNSLEVDLRNGEESAASWAAALAKQTGSSAAPPPDPWWKRLLRRYRLLKSPVKPIGFRMVMAPPPTSATINAPSPTMAKSFSTIGLNSPQSRRNPTGAVRIYGRNDAGDQS